MKILDVPQRSEEWRAARLGKLTASRAADMLATINKGEAAGRRNLRMQLVLERITGKCQESGYVSAAMQQGSDREVDALSLYEAETGLLLNSVGFVAHDTLMAGCSPDGYVGRFEGIIEIKSPLPATHWDYLKSGVIPDAYQKQIVHALWITGARWCEWLSFNPDFPESLQTKLVRVIRDEAQIESYEAMATLFLAEVDRECAAVQTMAGACA